MLYLPFTIVSFDDVFFSFFLFFFFAFLFVSLYLRPRLNKQKRYKNRIHPDKLNNWFSKACKEKILDRAIEYLDIETDSMTPAQCIIIPYPVFYQTKRIKDGSILRVKTSAHKHKSIDEDIEHEDDYYSYSYWNIQVLILNKSFISFYFCSYNLLTDEIINERSNEYFYQDIATIKTETNAVSFVSKWHNEPLTEARITQIIHNSGDILKLITEIPALKQPPQTIIDIEKVEKTIRLIIRHTRDIDENRKTVTIDFIHEPAEKTESVEL